MAEGTASRPMDGYEFKDFKSTKHENITEAERAFYMKIGRVVVINLTFTVGTKITGNSTTLFSGLPKAVKLTRFRIANTGATSDTQSELRLGVGLAGSITNQYSWASEIPVGTYEGEAVYICE